MNAKNTKELFEKFPELFKHRDNIQTSLMCFGFECDDGWYDIIAKLCQDIENFFIREHGGIPEHFYVTQVKEKFGGLRFYITSAPPQIFDMIHEAEQYSSFICEVCGKPGKLRDDLSWWRTLCNEHYNNKINENIEKMKKYKEKKNVRNKKLC